MDSAVLFIVFNRPATTRPVFEQIRLARPPRLYVAADGPRPDKAGEWERCREVREIASAVDWPCQVHTLFREANMGCDPAVTSAIDWFFRTETEGIVLEDDCVPVQDFFRFCDFALAHWRFEERVMHVGGTVMWPGPKNSELHLSRIVPIWGWATWRRAWAHYDPTMGVLDRLDSLPLQQWFGIQHMAVAETFRRVRDKHRADWDSRWWMSVLGRGCLSVLPPVNLVSNVGFGVGATHTKVDSPLANLRAHSLPAPLSGDAGNGPSAEYDEAYLTACWRRQGFVPLTIARLRYAVSSVLRHVVA